MTLATLIQLTLKTSIALTVLAVGLRAGRGDARSLFRDRARLARSFLAMDVVMPLVAVALAFAFGLHPAVKVALVTLAVSPVPPLLPKKALRAGGSGSYVVGLLAGSALVAVVAVPAAVLLVGRITGDPRHLPAAAVAKLVSITVLAPLLAGIALRRLAPARAERAAPALAKVATALLAAGCLPILATAWRPVVSLVGNGTLLALGVFAAAGLAAGHLLAGPAREDRVVLALSTASRHPGVAIAAGAAIAPEQKQVFAAVLLYLLVSGVLTAVYLRIAGLSRTAPS